MSQIATHQRHRVQREGVALLGAIVGLMWVVEAINAADSYRLRADGIYARDPARIWGIFTAPFIHANFAPHLLDNTIPLLFLGLIIALQGAGRLARVSAIVIIAGRLGTWLIGPPGVSTIGSSGVVFGYASYLLARGFFDRSALELLTGLLVGVIWGAALLSSLVPHSGVSWQGHLCGGLAGILAAYLLRRPPARRLRGRTAPALPG